MHFVFYFIFILFVGCLEPAKPSSEVLPSIQKDNPEENPVLPTSHTPWWLLGPAIPVVGGITYLGFAKQNSWWPFTTVEPGYFTDRGLDNFGMKAENYRLVPVPADGNCAFYSSMMVLLHYALKDENSYVYFLNEFEGIEQHFKSVYKDAMAEYDKITANTSSQIANPFELLETHFKPNKKPFLDLIGTLHKTKTGRLKIIKKNWALLSSVGRALHYGFSLKAQLLERPTKHPYALLSPEDPDHITPSELLKDWVDNYQKNIPAINKILTNYAWININSDAQNIFTGYAKEFLNTPSYMFPMGVTKDHFNGNHYYGAFIPWFSNGTDTAQTLLDKAGVNRLKDIGKSSLGEIFFQHDGTNHYNVLIRQNVFKHTMAPITTMCSYDKTCLNNCINRLPLDLPKRFLYAIKCHEFQFRTLF